MALRSFGAFWALILVSAPVGDGSGASEGESFSKRVVLGASAALGNFSEISKLLEEKELLQQQVQQLQEEIRLRTSGKHDDPGHNECTYVQKQVKSLQTVANEKEKEIDSLNEQLREVRQSFDRMQATDCAQNDIHERYANRQVTFKGNYTFLVKPLQRSRYDDPKTMEHLLQGVLYSVNFYSPM